MNNNQQFSNKFVDQDFLYWIKDRRVPNMFCNLEKFKQSPGKKISYLTNFVLGDDALELFYNKIKEHQTISDHVCVVFNEAGFYYTGKDGYPYCTVIDFVNRFSRNDNVTFFTHMVPLTETNRPIYFINKMLWPEAYNMYQSKKNNPLELIIENNKKNTELHWDILLGLTASHKDTIYEKINNHSIKEKVFMTYFKNNTEDGSWSNFVKKPKTHTAETVDRSNIRVSELMDPTIYNQTYYSFVCETFSNPNMACFTEKFAKPVIAQRPFVVFGSEYHLRAFRRLGFKTFHPIIDESYDEETNKDRRIDKIIQSMHELSSKDPITVLEALRPVLEHNKNHFFNNQWNSEFLQYWNS
jgi:hypothetical protein